MQQRRRVRGKAGRRASGRERRAAGTARCGRGKAGRHESGRATRRSGEGRRDRGKARLSRDRTEQQPTQARKIVDCERTADRAHHIAGALVMDLRIALHCSRRTWRRVARRAANRQSTISVRRSPPWECPCWRERARGREGERQARETSAAAARMCATKRHLSQPPLTHLRALTDDRPCGWSDCLRLRIREKTKGDVRWPHADPLRC